MGNKMPPAEFEDSNIPDARAFLRQVLVAQDHSSKLWPAVEVKRTQAGFAKNGGIPSYERLCEVFEEQVLEATLRSLIDERRAELRFQGELQGVGHPCHSCGGLDTLNHYDFGIVRVHTEQKDWKAAGLSVALSAVTLPLLGVGRLYGPGKTTTGNLLKLRIVLCKSCTNARRNFFGAFVVKESHCVIHPLWKELREAGFTMFVPTQELWKWI
jgi:hypothetical protein